MNPTKYVQDIHTEHYETLKKEIKENQVNREIYHARGSGRHKSKIFYCQYCQIDL